MHALYAYYRVFTALANAFLVTQIRGAANSLPTALDALANKVRKLECIQTLQIMH